MAKRKSSNQTSFAENNYLYELTDHLGNVRVVAQRNGSQAVAVVKTDYYPFGMPLPGRDNDGNQSQYRYKYQGQEKDSETGKEAFELRLWDARVGRWLTTDTYRQYNSPYLGMGNNPISGVDTDGGYKTWFGAFMGWVGSGFEGSIQSSSDAATPLHKYYLNKTGDRKNGIVVDFGGIKIKG